MSSQNQNFSPSEPSINGSCFYLLDVQSLLQKFGSDGSLLKESVLIGCSEQNRAQFCLDVGKNQIYFQTQNLNAPV